MFDSFFDGDTKAKDDWIKRCQGDFMADNTEMDMDWLDEPFDESHIEKKVENPMEDANESIEEAAWKLLGDTLAYSKEEQVYIDRAHVVLKQMEIQQTSLLHVDAKRFRNDFTVKFFYPNLGEGKGLAKSREEAFRKAYEEFYRCCWSMYTPGRRTEDPSIAGMDEKLNIFCQKKGLKTPTFTYTKNEGKFRCTVSVGFSSETCGGDYAKEAQCRAAKLWLNLHGGDWKKVLEDKKEVGKNLSDIFDLEKEESDQQQIVDCKSADLKVKNRNQVDKIFLKNPKERNMAKFNDSFEENVMDEYQMDDVSINELILRGQERNKSKTLLSKSFNTTKLDDAVDPSSNKVSSEERNRSDRNKLRQIEQTDLKSLPSIESDTLNVLLPESSVRSNSKAQAENKVPIEGTKSGKRKFNSAQKENVVSTDDVSKHSDSKPKAKFTFGAEEKMSLKNKTVGSKKKNIPRKGKPAIAHYASDEKLFGDYDNLDVFNFDEDSPPEKVRRKVDKKNATTGGTSAADACGGGSSTFDYVEDKSLEKLRNKLEKKDAAGSKRKADAGDGSSIFDYVEDSSLEKLRSKVGMKDAAAANRRKKERNPESFKVEFSTEDSIVDSPPIEDFSSPDVTPLSPVKRVKNKGKRKKTPEDDPSQRKISGFFQRKSQSVEMLVGELPEIPPTTENKYAEYIKFYSKMEENIKRDLDALDKEKKNEEDYKEFTAENAKLRDRLHVELDETKIKEMVRENIDYLQSIKNGSVKSERHDQYLQGGGPRRHLVYRLITDPFTEDQITWTLDEMSKVWLRNEEEKRENNDYIWKVLLSECFIKLYMDHFSKGRKEAEFRILNTPLLEEHDFD